MFSIFSRNRDTWAGKAALAVTDEYIHEFELLLNTVHSKEPAELLLHDFLKEITEIISHGGCDCSKREEKELEEKRQKLVALYVQCISSATTISSAQNVKCSSHRRRTITV